MTKETIRNEMLESLDKQNRHPYQNSSGGSTGEPVTITQDKYYSDWNIANKIYYASTLGKEIGEREIKIWGSERDVFEGTIGLKAKIHNYLFNRIFINSFNITDKLTEEIITVINTKKPRIIWGYVDSLYEIAKRANKSNRHITPPLAIICSAGTLYPEMKESIERAFGAKAINQYGSREVGDIACGCLKSNNAHIFEHTHLIEIVDKYGNPTNSSGRVLVTSLRNYSMPLIRYEIGDIAEFSQTMDCECGRKGRKLSMIWGRKMQIFYNKKGDAIPPEYFIHLVGVVFNSGEIQKFQIIQEKLDQLRIKYISKLDQSDTKLQKMKKNIIDKTKLVMGDTCLVIFEKVTSIPKSRSGKYLYTINNLAENEKC
jgi:phenylacetate-CoA ligase